MNQAYFDIKNISSLGDILTYIQSIENPKDLIVFFDWDDTLVNPDYDNIIEPKITKDLFDYMVKNNIHFSIITGRFYESSCDDKLRDTNDMFHNVVTTMFPTIEKLGINTSKYLTPLYTANVYKISNEQNECVGILYMGIFFSGKKGETIKHYLRQAGINKKHVLFIDDYEPYLTEVTASFPEIQAYRRHQPYTKL